MDQVLNLLNEYSQFALLISIGISIIIAILGVVPSVFVTGANLIFFGPFLGFVVSLMGECIGNYISFKVYKKGLKNTIEKKASKYKIIEKISKSGGNKCAFLIFEARVIPFVPSGVVTLAASLSSIDSLRYNIATFFGKMPSIGIEMLVSYGVISNGAKGIQAIIAVAGVYFIWRTLKKGDK